MPLASPGPGRRLSVELAAAFLMLGAPAAQSQDAPLWRIEQAEVRVVCPMTVGGSFEAKTRSLTGTLAESSLRPLALEGDLTVDLRTLDSGIGLRNDHLQKEYLEVEKGVGFEKAVLSAIHLDNVDARTFQGRTTFSGAFLLHGTKQAVAGEAVVRHEGSSVRVEASFPVALDAYGIAKPQYLGVGVKTMVQVKVSLLATPVLTSGGGAK